MPGSYRSLVAIPRARAFMLAGFVGRMPMAMRALACVLMVSELSGSYGLAGATAGVLTLAQAAASPRLGRLVERRGQRPVLLASLALHALGTLGLSPPRGPRRRSGACSPRRRSPGRRPCPSGRW